MGSRVRFGLNVGATEREITEEVEFEVLFSSLANSVVDVLINLVVPKEGETVVALLALTCIRPLPNRTRMNQESMLTSPDPDPSPPPLKRAGLPWISTKYSIESCSKTMAG